MSARYRLTPAARTNVDEICEFIAENSVEAALHVHEALQRAFEGLAGMPGMGHTREDLTDRPVRFWPVHSYLVVYDPASAPLTVIAVLHGARDVAQILRDIEQ